MTRRGQTVRFDHLPSADGSYELGLVTRDSSGHVSRMKPVRFRLDRTPPVLAVVLPGESRTYIGSVDILLVTDDREDRIESVRIDGRSLPETEIRREGEARKVTVNTYGTHRLTASAADAAGNRSGEVSCRGELHGPRGAPYVRESVRAVRMAADSDGRGGAGGGCGRASA